MIIMKCGSCKGTGNSLSIKEENKNFSEFCKNCNGEGFVEYILKTKEIKKFIITKAI